jgi:hypothetical protein
MGRKGLATGPVGLACAQSGIEDRCVADFSLLNEEGGPSVTLGPVISRFSSTH